jgi:dephospho-CoA kinase
LKKIGITGGIGSGKSLVCAILECFGFPVFYSDIEAKILLESNQKIKEELILIFGNEIYSSGSLDKLRLSKILFSDKKLLLKLNSIVHPQVRLKFDEWAKNQNSRFVFNESAILFETGGYTKFDATILVIAPLDLKIKRIISRDSISENQVFERMNNQWSDEEKIKFATYVINNDEKEGVLQQVEDILKLLDKK